MTSTRGWIGLRWLAVVGLLIGTLGTIMSPAARAADAGEGELETATLAPADSLLFASLNSDASSEQWGLAADLLKQGGLEDLIYGTAQQLVDGSGLPAEWVTPGSSLLGDEVSVVLLSGGESGVEPVVILHSAHPNQAFETLRSRYLASGDPRDFTPVFSNGYLTLITAYNGRTSLARIDDLIVFGTITAVQQVVGVANGAEPSLADSSTFTDLVDELDDDRIATAWANGPALSVLQTYLYPELVQAGLGVSNVGLISPLVSMATTSYQAVGMWAEEKGFRLDSRAMAGPRAETLTAPDDKTDLADSAPEDALLYVDGMNLGAVSILRSYVDSIAFGFGADATFNYDSSSSEAAVFPTVDENYAALEKLLGFDVRADVLDQLEGDYGLWVSSSSLENVDDATAVMVSDVTDPATVDGSIGKLVRLLGVASGGDLTVNRLRLGDATVSEILLPGVATGGTLRVTIGVVEGKLLIGVGDGMEQYLDGPRTDSLAVSDRFSAAFDALPTDKGARFYLDVHRVIELQDLAALEPTMGLGDPLEDPQLASLDGIQALAAVTRMDRDQQVTSVVLTIDASAAEDASSTPEAAVRPGAEASPAATGSELAILGVTPVEPKGRVLSASPVDGVLLVDRDDDGICIVDADGSDEVCGGPVRSLDRLHIAWSPDGRRVAFSENAATYLIDSDIHVFDRDAGQLQNWTNDGYEGGIPLTDKDATVPTPLFIDMTPAWTPDGTAVVFSRTAVTGGFSGATTILYRADGVKKEPMRVAPVATFPLATYFGMAYAQDGRLLYTNTSSDPSDSANGLYELSADGKSVRPVIGSGRETGPPELVGVTAENSALVSYPQFASRYLGQGPDGICTLALVDLATTRQTPMTMPDGSCAYFAGVFDGGSRVLLYSPLSSETGGAEFGQLAVVDAANPGAPAVAIDSSEMPSGKDIETGAATVLSGNDDYGLTITQDGQLFLRDGPTGGAFIQLG